MMKAVQLSYQRYIMPILVTCLILSNIFTGHQWHQVTKNAPLLRKVTVNW